MRKIHILKINGHSVLNFYDLQEHFSPWPIWEQRESYASFVKVHSLPLKLWMDKENGIREVLRYWEKGFWLRVLEKQLREECFPEMSGAVECLQQLGKQDFGADLSQEEASKRMELEFQQQRLAEKLNYIVKSAKLTDSAEDRKTAIVLLAICQLAEMDADKQDFQRWTEPEPEVPVQHVKEISRKKPLAVAGQPFPLADRVTLKARSQPYDYQYHEANVLMGKKIKTVRVEAVDGDRADSLVTIILRNANGSAAVTVRLKPGQYRDCTVSEGQVIGFLPTMSISKTLCIARKDYSSPDIRILPRNGSEWLLDVDVQTARKITCFSAGDNAKEGFLYIRNGKLTKIYYKQAEDYTTRQKLDMVDDRLVEVLLADGTYRLLTEYGEVISGDPAWDGKTGVPTLYPRESAEGTDTDVLEAVAGPSQKTYALRHKNGRVDWNYG